MTNDPLTFKLRCSLILGIFILWGIAIACKTYTNAILHKTDLLGKARVLAWREGSIPPQRGRILDKNNTILASDKFRCDLVMDYYPLHPHREKRLWRKLHIMDPAFKLKAADTVFPHVIKSNLDLEESLRYRRLFLGSPEVRVHGYFERVYPYPALETLLGSTALNDRKESVGLSGLEKQYDVTLAGKSGQFVVMLNRDGNWVSDTVRILKKPVNGQDIRLPQTWKEMLAYDKP